MNEKLKKVFAYIGASILVLAIAFFSGYILGITNKDRSDKNRVSELERSLGISKATISQLQYDIERERGTIQSIRELQAREDEANRKAREADNRQTKLIEATGNAIDRASIASQNIGTIISDIEKSK